MSRVRDEFVKFMEENQGCTYNDINKWAMEFAPMGYKRALDRELEELINDYIESRFITVTVIHVKDEDDVIEDVTLYYYSKPSMWHFKPYCEPVYKYSVDQYIVRRDMRTLNNRMQRLTELKKMTKEGIAEIETVADMSGEVWDIVSTWR